MTDQPPGLNPQWPQQPGQFPQQPGQFPQPGPYPQQPGGPTGPYPWQPPPGFQPPKPPKRKNKGVRIGCLSVLGLAVLIIIIGAIASAVGGNKGTGSSSGSGSSNSSGSSLSSQSPAAVVQSSAPAAAPTSAPAAPQYTVSQQSAIQAAQQYLSMGSGFSRAGLIQQLDSSAGSGFSVADATFAVNHIKVNWDHQAALSAKGYMQMGGFSYSSMVQQLESSAGEGFTYAQAVYGAKSVGL